MHRVRAALVSGGASAYRLIARKSGVPTPRRRSSDAPEEPTLDPAIVVRDPQGMSRIERASILHTLRDESMPEDGSLAHWITNVEGDQPLLAKNGRPEGDPQSEEEASLAGEMVPRRESRTADTRREDRVAGIVETAVLSFRGEDHIVRVVNTSSRGLQVEGELTAHIAEELSIRLDGAEPTPVFVRWIRGGRIGLGFREDDLSD